MKDREISINLASGLVSGPSTLYKISRDRINQIEKILEEGWTERVYSKETERQDEK